MRIRKAEAPSTPLALGRAGSAIDGACCYSELIVCECVSVFGSASIASCPIYALLCPAPSGRTFARQEEEEADSLLAFCLLPSAFPALFAPAALAKVLSDGGDEDAAGPRRRARNFCGGLLVCLFAPLSLLLLACPLSVGPVPTAMGFLPAVAMLARRLFGDTGGGRRARGGGGGGCGGCGGCGPVFCWWCCCFRGCDTSRRRPFPRVIFRVTREFSNRHGAGWRRERQRPSPVSANADGPVPVF